MLRLREKAGGTRPASAPRPRRDDLARAGRQIDPDATRDEELCGGDVRAARPDDRIDGRDVSVPYASAATAWAPPTAYTSSTPSSRAATRIASDGLRRHDGDAPHAATSAGTAVMTSEDGSGERPLGTQRPTESRASQRRSERSPEPPPRACRAGAARR